MSEKIIISEFYPNPEGKDSGQEWIELYNPHPTAINIQDWELKIGKSIIIKEKNIIPPQSYLLISKSINLNNQGGSIILYNQDKETIDQINYPKSIEGKSYSRSSIEKKETWQWLTPTPLEQNTKLSLITGKIIKPPNIDKEFNFQVQSANHSIYQIIIPEESRFLQIKELLPIGDQIKIIGTPLSDKRILLNQYQLTTEPPPEKEKETAPSMSDLLLIPIIALLIILILISIPWPTLHRKPSGTHPP